MGKGFKMSIRSYIIYVKDNAKSEEYANVCLKSCKNSGFDAELFEGVQRSTLKYWDDKLNNLQTMENSRAYGHSLDTAQRYETKKSCFLNHVRLWQKCVELEKPISILEHDSYCIQNWNDLEFDELLILNITSAFNQKVFSGLQTQVQSIDWGFGLNNYTQSPLIYTKNINFKGGLMMPGTAAYAVTPKGAKRLLSHLYLGWEQSDYYINTKSVNIQYILPENFTFKLPNLRMSHGL